MYIDMHEIFFVEFPFLLFEWIKRKNPTNSPMWLLAPVVWDQANLEEMKVLDKKWTQDIKFWFA
jgi:hypothetical protein